MGFPTEAPEWYAFIGAIADETVDLRLGVGAYHRGPKSQYAAAMARGACL